MTRFRQRVIRKLRREVLSRVPGGGALNYRFLVRDWNRVNDIDTIARAVEIEYFRDALQPSDLQPERIRSLVIIAPHQDDETIGAGGTALIAAGQGAAVHVLFATDGAQEALGHSPAGWASRRAKEARAVCRGLGAQMHVSDLSNLSMSVSARHLDQIAQLLWNVRPEVVMTPWIFDRAPKHRFINLLIYFSHLRSGLPAFEWWGYQTNNSLYPNGYVDITKVAEDKRRLLQLYESQNDNYRRYDHQTLGLNAWNSRFLPGSRAESYAEIFFAVPSPSVLGMIERFYMPDLEKLFRGNAKLVERARDAAGLTS